MSFGEAVARCYGLYWSFAGRARRAEYWYFALFCLLMQVATGLVDAMLVGYRGDVSGPLQALFVVATILPSLSVLVRRLHDTGRSGWWFWLVLVPGVGWLILLVILALPGTPGANRHGPDPLEGEPGPLGLSPSRIPHVPRRGDG